MAHTSQNKLSQPANMRCDSKTISNPPINLNGASGAHTSGSEEKPEWQQRLEIFVGTFVTEIDTKFGVYQVMLEGGKNVDKKSCLKEVGEGIGLSAVNLFGYIIPLPGGLASLGGKLGGAVAEELGEVTYKKKLTCLSRLIYSYQNNKDVQKKILVEAGIQIFRSFEMQIMGLGGKRAWEFSVIMLGKDAAQRVINFCAEESVEEFTVSRITIGVLQGRSRKPSSWIPWKRGLNVEYKDAEVTTEDIFTLVGILDIENKLYYTKKDGKNNATKCGYRVLFTWETNDSKGTNLQCYKKQEKPPENEYKYIFKTENVSSIQEKLTTIICAKEWHPTEETVVSVLRELVDEIMDTITSKASEELEQVKKLIAKFDCDYAKQLQVILEEREKNILQGVERECSLTREHTSQEMEWTRTVIQKDLSEKYEVILQGIVEDGNKTRSLVSETLVSHAKSKLFILPFIPVETRVIREGVLNQLHSYLHIDNVKRMVVVCGLGGVGKSELAREYAQNHCEEYDNIVWIDAESYDSLCHSFLDAARKLKIETRVKMCDTPTERNITDIVSSVYDELQDNKCLFIFDDAQKYRSESNTDVGLANFFPSRSVKTFYVIITSCSSDWDSSVPKIDLEVFQESESLDLLKKLLGNKYEENDARLLSMLVDHLPLGLQIAAAYINDQNITIRTLLKECEQKKTDIIELKFPSSSMDNSKKNIFTTFEVIIDSFCKQYGEEAVTILNILAYLNPRNIPEDLFSCLGEEKKIRTIILALIKYSIVMKKLNEPLFYVHTSVQEVIRKKLGNTEESALKKALDLLKFKMSDKTDNVIEQHVEHIWHFTCNHPTLVEQYHTMLAYPLHRAAQLKNLNMVKYLIEKEEVYVYTRDRGGMTPLYRANQQDDNMEVISYLISECAQQHTNQHTEDWKIVEKAAQEKKQAIVKFLINESGADPSLEKNMLLCLAVQNGRLDVVTFLLENRADILFVSSNGVTVLHEAVVSNNCSLIEFVIDQIDIACKIRSQEVSNYINAQDRVGDTPLMWAAEAWKVDAVKVLRNHGADIGVRNTKNKTACDIAKQTANELLQ